MQAIDAVVARYRRLSRRQLDVGLALAVAAAELAHTLNTAAAFPACDVCRLTPLRMAFPLIVAVPLVWRRSHPLWVLGVVGVAAAVNGVVDGPTLNLGIIIAVYSVAAYGSLPVALGALALILGALLTVHGLRGFSSVTRIDLTTFGSIWLLGRLAATHRAYIAELEEKHRSLEREAQQRTELAAGEERRRIARELHDVVAHGVTEMLLGTRAARAALDQPDRADATLGQVEASGRRSLEELRSVLGVLRRSEEETRSPQPGLAELPALARRFEHMGIPVSLRTDVDGALPETLQLSAYRIVEEALTNAARHAQPKRVQVEVAGDEAGLSITVENDGAHPRESTGGHGLRGMRERATAVGGTLEAGPTDGDGFRVSASLPAGP